MRSPCSGKRAGAAEAFLGLAVGEVRQLQGSLVPTGHTEESRENSAP